MGDDARGHLRSLASEWALICRADAGRLRATLPDGFAQEAAALWEALLRADNMLGRAFKVHLNLEQADQLERWQQLCDQELRAHAADEATPITVVDPALFKR